MYIHLCLNEVVLHKLLKVEVGDFFLVGNIKKSLELGIRYDLATVVRSLKTIFLDVRSDHLGNISVSHLGSWFYAKELSKIGGNGSWLDESTRAREPLFLLRLALTLSMVLASRRTCFSRILKSALSLLRLVVRV